MSSPLEPGLYLVATPIGNARDITLRAMDVLSTADRLVAEDTRMLRKLMEIHGIPVNGRPVSAYHDHSGPGQVSKILEAVAAGQSVAYCSDAGMPLIADPGYELVRAASEAGIAVTALPGASSVPTALALSGIATDRFLFAGFAPKPGASRSRFLAELGAVPATLVLFETAKRLPKLLADMAEAWGGEREAAVCRELTKKFEEVRRASLAELAERYADGGVKGEVVLVIERGAAEEMDEASVQTSLKEQMAVSSLRDSVDHVAQSSGWPRKRVYALALELAKEA